MVDAQDKVACGRQQYHKIARRRAASCQQYFDIIAAHCHPCAALFCASTIMRTTFFYTFLPLYCCARYLAVALELQQWFLNDDGFSSTDILPSIICSLLYAKHIHCFGETWSRCREQCASRFGKRSLWFPSPWFTVVMFQDYQVGFSILLNVNAF
jgi:hypothetical protein